MHWSLFALLVVTLVGLLVVQGFTTRTTGESATSAGVGADAPFAGSGPLLTAQGGGLGPSGPQRPGRRIALSFDDGPDPVWTPRIAATLKRLGATGTFFVVGSEVAEHPEVLRDLHRQGFELGNHTFGHTGLTDAPRWRQDLEIALTEATVVGAVGVRPRLMRPPYSSTPVAVSSRQASALTPLARSGYVVALSTHDGEDWRRAGPEAIAHTVTPRGEAGGVVLLHDGGGDRSQTVAALERVVPELKRRRFRFVPVSAMGDLTRAAVELPANSFEELLGKLLIGALTVARWTTNALAGLLALVLALTVVRIVLVVPLARRHARSSEPRVNEPSFTPPVSIVVPAYNESAGIEKAVRSLAASNYPDFEVVVVDDGSNDGTPELVEGLGFETVRVIRQPNSGKATALNTGVAAAASDMIVMVDADTVFEPASLRRLVEPLADPRVGSVSGNAKVGNRKGVVGRWQHIEYVIGFNLDRRLCDLLRCMPTVPGSIGAFRREALVDVGGVSPATLAEDTDITLAIGRAGWRIVFVEDARAWTEAPGSLGALWRQRYRWSYGTMQAVWKNRAAIWRTGERRIGLVGIPYVLLFQIMLPLAGPVVDLFALYGLVFLDPVPVAGLWIAFNLVQLWLGLLAFRLDGESPRALWALPLQQVVYRQMMYVVVIQAVVSSLQGVRLGWQHVERTGEFEVAH